MWYRPHTGPHFSRPPPSTSAAFSTSRVQIQPGLTLLTRIPYRGQVHRHALGQGVHGALRSVVRPAVRLRDPGGDARHVDDGAAATVADGRCRRVGHRRVGDRPRLQAAQPRLPVGAEPGGDERERVVHQVVHPAPAPGRLLHQPPAEGLLGMVAAAGRHLVFLPGEVAHGLLDQIGLDPGEGHRGAFRAELLDHGAADAGRPAGHDRHLAGEAPLDRLSLLHTAFSMRG